MKSKLILIASVMIALGVGFFAGRFHAGRAWNRFFLDYVHVNTSNQAHFWVRALSHLQDGDQNKAVEFMESRLDGSMLTFIGYEGLQPEERNPAGLRAIRVVRDYRSQHPWQNPNPETRYGIQRVFSLVE